MSISASDNDSQDKNLDEGLVGEGGNKKERMSLPLFPLFVLSIVIFSEPMSSTILLPFVYFIVRDFHLTDNDKEIRFYAASSFFFAQFCCVIFWGYMSDKFGRRPILLIGLLGNIISCTSFDTSKTLWWAIASRSLNGGLNANVGVTKSLLGEITDSTNKARAFSMFGLTWGIGCIRPTIGGYLSHPADHFSRLVCRYFMLPETRNIIRKSEYKPESELLLYTKHNNRSDDVGSYGISSLNGNRETRITDNNSTLSTDNWKFRLLHDISPAIPSHLLWNILNTISREVLGTVNGIGQTIASLSRAIGSALGGVLWAWSLNNNLRFPFDRYFVFIVMSAMAFIGWLQSYRIPRRLFKS
ncbi:6138_t:CDS:2 [Ambispora gerdemannii]|uniref:6138_t:CDS:1 n=1 Tax=Ambispora gerdemannii TaxID=144530 RepID=A0A9N8ZPU5_9GLOM|nr:6138_t:CDS:2 [Ambispora gerdemannii]